MHVNTSKFTVTFQKLNSYLFEHEDTKNMKLHALVNETISKNIDLVFFTY